jgi:hypothetical protein
VIAFSAGFHVVYALPALEPFVIFFYSAFLLPVTEGDSSQFAIVPDLECRGAIAILVDLEDEIGGIGRVLYDAGLALAVLVYAFFEVLVDALGTG